jgi:hypothetical protein
MNRDRRIRLSQSPSQGTAEFAEALDQDPVVTNIYVNLQQLKPGSLTDKRQDVARYVRFLLDIDRKNKKIDGVRVNANEEERDSLRKVAEEVSKWVSSILRAHPLVADSGNGFHLSWNLRLAFTDAIAPDEDNKTSYKECLLAIKQRFDSESVEIDASLSEPEQIIRLWGTWNRRDPETEGRPHRQSVEKARGTVSLARLGLLDCEYEAPAKNPSLAGSGTSSPSVWISPSSGVRMGAGTSRNSLRNAFSRTVALYLGALSNKRSARASKSASVSSKPSFCLIQNTPVFSSTLPDSGVPIRMG